MNARLHAVQQVVCAFSLKPLLQREGLLVPLAVCTAMYVGASTVRGLSLSSGSAIVKTSVAIARRRSDTLREAPDTS